MEVFVDWSEFALMAGKDGESPRKESKWEELVSQIEPIANPLAPRKLTKRLYKVLKKGVYRER